MSTLGRIFTSEVSEMCMKVFVVSFCSLEDSEADLCLDLDVLIEEMK